MKTCTKCKRSREADRFGKYYNGRSQTRTICKNCANENRRKHHRERRIKAFKHFGEKCADCKIKSSSKNYIIFDFHHIDPRNKELSFSESWSVSDTRYWKEINKCVMLCSNCHRLRHWDKRASDRTWTCNFLLTKQTLCHWVTEAFVGGCPRQPYYDPKRSAALRRELPHTHPHWCIKHGPPPVRSTPLQRIELWLIGWKPIVLTTIRQGQRMTPA